MTDTFRSLACRARALLLRFARGRAGVAAVEFAIILPVALTLYIGAASLTDAIATSRRVDTLTLTMVDLASKQSTSQQLLSIPTPANAVTQAVIQQIVDGATTLIDPAPEGPLSLTLSAVDVLNLPTGVCCAAKVRWSYTKNGTLRPCNLVLLPIDPSQVTQPDGFSSTLLPVGTPLLAPLSFLIADVKYNYQPLISASFLPIKPLMQRTLYMMPRSPGQVIAANLTAPPTGGSGGKICY